MGRCACKHRKIRREIILRVRRDKAWQRCSFFIVVSGAGPWIIRLSCAALSRSSFKSRMPECQSGDAGASPADRTNFQKHNCYNNTAGASLRSSVSKTLRARGSTETPCHFSNCGVAKWEGNGLISRLRAGSIPAPATNFMGRSIIQEVTRPASGRARCKAVAVHHFKSREG